MSKLTASFSNVESLDLAHSVTKVIQERDQLAFCLTQAIAAIESLAQPNGWPWFESREEMLSKWKSAIKTKE